MRRCERPSGARRLRAVAMASWALAVAAVGAACLALTDGRLVLSLDDPYIHLSVARSILAGGYGVNAGELSSPSSSALYPLILAITEAAGFGAWGPFVIGLGSAGAAVWLLAGILASHTLPPGRAPGLGLLALAALLPYAASAVALPFTGMEHGLHIVLAILALRELERSVAAGQVTVLLVVATALMPLLRFEGAALAGGVAIALAALGLWRGAALAGGLSAAGLGAYGSAMLAAGLPLLPSSVSTKWVLTKGDAETVGPAGEILGAGSLAERLTQPTALVLALSLVALLAALGRRPAPAAPARAVAIAASLALLGHLVAGHYGHFFRYEVYALTIAAVAVMIVWGPALAAGLETAPPARCAAVGLLAVAAILPFVTAALRTPVAARSIYAQQYQMGRFVAEAYPMPVAVNDLGLVAYRSPDYVLDLFGLGSETVRQLKVAGRYEEAAIAGLVEARAVPFAMIYSAWFAGRLPRGWCHVATLVTPPGSVAFGGVAFFATRPDAVAPLGAAIAGFAPSLPAISRFVPSGAPCAEG